MKKLSKKMIGIISAALAVVISAGVIIPIAIINSKKTGDTNIADTSIVLAQDHKTDYKIVIPAVPTDKESLAADELKLVFDEYTGADIEIIDDENIVFNTANKHLSIGNTKIFAAAKEKAPVDLGASGFFIKRKDNTVIIGADGYFGVLYGTYDFIEINLGIKHYGFGEIFYPEKKDKIYLKDFDYYDMPDFEYRDIDGRNLTVYDSRTRDRFRLTMHRNWLEGFTAHTTLKLLPYAQYKDNEGWFNSQGTEISLTSEGARNQLIENLKQELLIAKPYNDTVMIGLADNWDIGDSDEDKASDALYTYSGSYVRFANAVAEEMERWEKENNLRSYNYSIFAYRKSQAAPTKYDSTKDIYLPIDSSVVPRHNVSIRFAPLDADFNHLLDDEDFNSATRKDIRSWKALTNNFKVWSYMVNFSEELVWFNDAHTTKANYLIYKEMGVNDIYDQSQGDLVLPAFINARLYVKSKLMWDLSRDPAELLEDFMTHFYKAAAPKMIELYNLVQTRYRMIDAYFQDTNWRGQKALITRAYTHLEPTFMTETYWPYDFLLQCNSLIAQAMTAAGDDEVLQNRISLESVSVDYLLLSLHHRKYEKPDLKELIDEFDVKCREHGLTRYAEHSGTLISIKIQEFRNNLK